MIKSNQFKYGDMVSLGGTECLVTFTSEEWVTIFSALGEAEVPTQDASRVLRLLDHGSDEVAVTCYRERTVWPTRAAAMQFYATAARECDGCEAERYANVLLDLASGLTEASDLR